MTHKKKRAGTFTTAYPIQELIVYKVIIVKNRGLKPIWSKRTPHESLERKLVRAPILAAQVSKLSERPLSSPKALYT